MRALSSELADGATPHTTRSHSITAQALSSRSRQAAVPEGVGLLETDPAAARPREREALSRSLQPRIRKQHGRGARGLATTSPAADRSAFSMHGGVGR